jgi:hypothetical protein
MNIPYLRKQDKTHTIPHKKIAVGNDPPFEVRRGSSVGRVADFIFSSHNIRRCAPRG